MLSTNIAVVKLNALLILYSQELASTLFSFLLISCKSTEGVLEEGTRIQSLDCSKNETVHTRASVEKWNRRNGTFST